MKYFNCRAQIFAKMHWKNSIFDQFFCSKIGIWQNLISLLIWIFAPQNQIRAEEKSLKNSIFDRIRRENSNILDFLPLKILNFGTKIQIDQNLNVFISLNFLTKKWLLVHCVLSLVCRFYGSTIILELGFRIVKMQMRKGL